MMSLKSVVLFTILTTVLSCSCLRETLQQRVCRSNLVVRARVVARFDNCVGSCDGIIDQVEGKITYIARVTRTFKGKKPEDNVLFLETAVNGALCGVTLNIGTKYLFALTARSAPTGLGGAFVKKETCPVKSIDVGLCQFPQPFTRLTKKEKRFLSKTSKKGDSGCPAA